MADYNEAVVTELTEKLSAYVKILPDHTESTTFRLLQHVTDEEVINSLTTDDLMEIDDRFHKAVEEMGHILAPNKFNGSMIITMIMSIITAAAANITIDRLSGKGLLYRWKTLLCAMVL